jgi:TP901 family phage tail tape measure protein
MADVNANIGVNIDTSDALNQLKNLQRQISQFHQSVAKSSAAASLAQRDLQKNFINGVNAIQGFSAELRTVRTSAESFTNSLEKNKFSIQQYFRYAASQTKTFGKKFTSEFATIEKTAIERVKTLQTQYVKMGRDASGAMQAIAIRPTVLDMKDLGTQTAIAAQKQVLFNQLIKQGSTNLLNFGKNTQWAGRQLMVGFTLPLATLGMTAGRVFMDMEKAAIKFKKVYGDLFTAPEETQEAMESITELGLAYTKYGVAVSDSLNVAAEAAAAGFQGVDLQNQTTASLKLSVLGQMELQKALETTIALQNAFRISSADLVGEIDFLNAVENQTVVSLQDITEATPRVATVIQALGGNVRDLAFFLAAMKEGGVNAAQGANALKSGLASLINPTERASEMLMGMGINIRGIVSQNQGDLRSTVVEFARALDTLDPMRRAQAIEQLFGKFQFARISALFDNVIREGSQASRVLDLAGASLGELADLSEKELGVSAASAMNKFRASIEQVKVALAPIGKLFLEIATPFIDFATTVLKAFNNLPDGIKKIIGTVITVVGGLGPVLLMTFGLINNGIANMIKFFATVRLGYLKMTGQAKGIGDETQYMTQEQLEAAAAASSLDQAHAGLTQRFTAEKAAVDALTVAYQKAAAAGAAFALNQPGMMKPGFAGAPTKMAKGGVVTVGGRGNRDTEPALLTPGEAVIPAPMVKQYGPLIEGMIAGNIPGYAQGVMLGMPKSAKSVSKNREAAEEIYQMFLKSSYANTPPTEYGHQISPSSGHSFPIFSLGGVYQKGNKQVFVKPVLDEKAALAEMRSTEISRRAHGLEAPQQRIVVIRDPLDTTRTRRFLALESDLDPKFVNNQPMGIFNEEQYFRQLVASLLRADKDLSGSNVFGNVVADAGPAGVFGKASGLRDYEKNLPSMEDQALINLLGIRGGAKRAFAESTLGMMAGLTPEQYRARMIAEIQKVLPRLKETIASFKLTDPTEVGVYDDMVRRLEQGLGVDWGKFHAIHSAVKPAKPKAKTQAAPLELANGIVSVPGPKGAGDVTPAMLSPGEAVIPTAMAKKYAPLIQGMIAGNIPGYKKGKTGGVVNFGGGDIEVANAGSARALQAYYNTLMQLNKETDKVKKMFAELVASGKKAVEGQDKNINITKAQAEKAAEKNKLKTKTDRPRGSSSSLAHLTLTDDSKINKKTGEREHNSLVRRMAHSQNKKLDTGQSSEEFSQQWKSVTGGLNEALVVGGLELTENVKKAAQQIDDEIHDTALALAKGGEVNAEILHKATNSVIKKYKSANGELGQVAKTMETLRDDKKHKIIMPPDKKSSIAAGLRNPGETARQEVERRLAAGEIKAVKKKKTIEYIVTEKGKHLTTDPEGRFTYEEDGQIKNRPRRAATELGATRQSTYLKMMSSNPEKLARMGVSINQGAEAAQEVTKAVQEEKAKTSKASEQLTQSVTETIVNSKDDVARATEEMVSPVTKKRTGPRRASSDPAVMAALEGNKEVVQASRRPRRATREADSTAPSQASIIAARSQKAAEDQLQGLQKMSMSISAVSFGLSTLTGVLSSFGLDLNGIMPVITGVTGALFALSMATSALTQAKFAETLASKINVASGGIGGTAGVLTGIKNILTGFKAGAKGLTGIGNIIKGVAGAFKTMFPILSRLIGPLAILATLFAGWELYNNIQEEAKRKLRGLSDAANMSSEQIKALGLAAGEQAVLEKASFKTEDTTGTNPNVAGQDRIDAKTFVENMGGIKEFEKEYSNQIKAIKEASGDQERLLALYRSLAIQFNALGMSEGTIEQIINALRMSAGEKDIVLDFKSLTIIGDDGTVDTTAIENRAKASLDAFKLAYDADLKAFMEKTKQAYKDTDGNYGEMPSDAEIETAFNTTTTTKVREGSNKVQTETIAATTSELQSLRAAFDAGTISLADYQAAISASISPLATMGDESKNLTDLLKSMEIDSTFVSSLTDISDKTAVLQAALAGIDVTEYQENLKSDDAEIKRQALIDLADATSKATTEQEKANVANNFENAISPVAEQIDALESQIAVYDQVAEASGDSAIAAQIAADGNLRAAWTAALAEDRVAGALDGQGAAAQRLLADVAQLNALTAQLDTKLGSGSRGGGSGKKSPFQEAIDSLKEQQKQAKNSITAYAKLRSAGLSVAESSSIAKDSMLAAALASEQVGSRKWNQLVAAIREARAEEEAWLNSTPEGRAEQFAGVYSKVMDVFRSQEDILDMNNETATATTRKLIEALEKQIEVYQRRSAELERDLDKISDKENEINKSYDKRTKALETVRKINQDIANQQKSQISIADALSRGDISAAAEAVEESRAEFASSQGDATQRGLDASRQAELESLTQNGKTRAQIEAEIKQIKQDIETIEFGALQNAKDTVEAADEITRAAKENLEVQGLTKTEWENINTRVEASKASAALHNAEVVKALENARSLVGEWTKLDRQYTTTHLVSTIYNSSGAVPPWAQTGFAKGGEVPKYFAGGGVVPRYFARGGVVPKYFARGGVVPKYFAAGGVVPKYFAKGGMPKGTDIIPAMLTPGEFVINKSATEANRPLLNAINSGSLASLLGTDKIVNPVYNMPERKYVDNLGTAGVYPTSSYMPSVTAEDNSVYNYSLSVNVEGSNASANDIANVVMNKIKTIESQQVRKQVLR